MEIKEIKNKLKKLGIKSGDTIMIHGDAGIAEQINTKSKKKTNILFNEIIKIIGVKGNILIPSFTYSACEKKVFNVLNTKSVLGKFSEDFRKKTKVNRTEHPIFSFLVYGKKFNYFKKSKIDTCFGKDSLFDRFKKINGKIICMGCSFNRVTFIHHVEEFFNVNYRYKKKFDSKIKIKNKIISRKIEYFVRKLNQRSSLNLQYLYKKLLRKKSIKETNLGRYNINVVSAKVLFNDCLEALNKKKNYLVQK